MISVCMATYNGEKFIYKQLESLYRQSRPADEVIICDDGSQDHTVEIVQQFIDTFQLSRHWKLFVNECNKGYPDNFYYAMSLCSGDLIFPADQDDWWKEDKLDVMAAVMEQDEKMDLLASKWGIVDQDDHILKEISHGTASEDGALREVCVRDIFYFYEWPGMCMGFRKELAEQVLEARRGSALAHDVALGLVAAEQRKFFCLNRVLQYHRRHQDNLAKEEHRIRKLLNKERKVDEIERYLKMLRDVEDSACLSEEAHIAIVEKKKAIMQERLENLLQGKRLAMLNQYRKHRDEVRPATLVCDLLIAGKKSVVP